MKNSRIEFGFSSCPNDTFMFDAIVNRRIDLHGLGFFPYIADIEELNSRVLAGIPDLCKISIAHYPRIADRYQILTSGSALGFRNGPLLVSKHKINPDRVHNLIIGIPGFQTTANYLLELLYSNKLSRKEFLFSEIEDKVLNEEVDAGLLIHEGRFTYASRGLQLITDLGEEWERRFELPVPLGSIVIKREIEDSKKAILAGIIKESVCFAFENPSASVNFVKEHAWELSEEVINNHISLYVNEFSKDLGDQGKKAIRFLLRAGNDQGLFNLKTQDIFF